VRVRIVVAHPGFKQVTEYVERICITRFATQKPQELLANLRALGLEV
jgi:hypothetical protein